MIVSQLISNINTGLLQNYGTIMTDDSQVLFTINIMLNHIYAYRVWKWAIVREEVTSTTNTFTLSKNAVHIIKVQTSDSEYKPTPLPFALTDDGISEQKKYFHLGKTITLSEENKTITVWYLKTPDKLTLSNLSSEIELPEEYMGILYFLCMRGLYPYNLENGASLANNFKSSFVDEMLKTFEKTHSLGLTIDAVQRHSVFNGK